MSVLIGIGCALALTGLGALLFVVTQGIGLFIYWPLLLLASLALLVVAGVRKAQALQAAALAAFLTLILLTILGIAVGIVLFTRAQLA